MMVRGCRIWFVAFCLAFFALSSCSKDNAKDKQSFPRWDSLKLEKTTIQLGWGKMINKEYKVLMRPVTVVVPKGWKKTKCRPGWCQFEPDAKAKGASPGERLFVAFTAESSLTGLDYKALNTKLVERRNNPRGTMRPQTKKKLENGAIATFVEGRLEQYGKIGTYSIHRSSKSQGDLKTTITPGSNVSAALVGCWAGYKWTKEISNAETDRIVTVLRKICTPITW